MLLLFLNLGVVSVFHLINSRLAAPHANINRHETSDHNNPFWLYGPLKYHCCSQEKITPWMYLTCFKTGDIHTLVCEYTNTFCFVLKGQKLQPCISKVLVHSQQTHPAGLISKTLCHRVFAPIHHAGINEWADCIDLLAGKCPGIAHWSWLDERHTRIWSQHPWVIRGELKQTNISNASEKVVWLFLLLRWHGMEQNSWYLDWEARGLEGTVGLTVKIQVCSCTTGRG